MHKSNNIVLAAILMLLVSISIAGVPTAPFVSDASTLILLHFDNTVADTAGAGYTVTMATAAGYTDPAYVTGQSGYGQAFSGTGVATQNGLVINPGTISQITSPLTIECWMKIPSSDSTVEFTNTILSLGAGRFEFVIRHAGPPDPGYVYPQLTQYCNGTAQMQYCAISNLVYSNDTWHHYAVTYDPSNPTTKVQFFFDGQKQALLNNGTQTTINGEFDKVSIAGLAAGKMWIFGSPTTNYSPLRGQLDEFRLSRGVRYGLSSGKTILQLSLNGNILDSGDYGFATKFSSIAGYVNPTYAVSTFGQALEGSMVSKTTINGVIINDNTISTDFPTPLTVDCWMYVPSSYSTAEYNQNVLDLAGGRFTYYLRKAGTPDPGYVYPTLSIVSNGQQYNYGIADFAHGWSYDAWHRFTVIYDSTTSADQAQFFIDGVKLATQGPALTTITKEYEKAADKGLVAGRVWPPSAPTFNDMPLIGRMDEITLLKGKITPLIPNYASLIYADRANSAITIDGSVSDWAALTSTRMHIDFAGSTTGGKLSADIRFAWDANFLYLLVQETTNPTTQTASNEAPNGILYNSGPYSFDGISFWVDLDNSNDNRSGNGVQDFNPWFGFSSAGGTDLLIARMNDSASLTAAPLTNAQFKAGGTFASHNRVIECKIKWTDLASNINTSRQPSGNLLGAIAKGFSFGCDPLIIDNNYNKQTYIGGGHYTVPTGADANSRDVMLVGNSPTSVPCWEIFE